MTAMSFRAAAAGIHWQGLELLAGICERAGLSVDRAEAARLVAGGCPMERLAPALSEALGEWVSGRQARRKAWEAGVRIRRSRPDLARCHREQAVEMLGCMRNVVPANPPVCIYPEQWGTVGRDPVRFRSRLLGEAPEDLVRHPLRFLRDLPRLLEPSAVRD
jgi:hypothetical protein